MAIIITGGGVTDIRGKLAGNVFKGNKSGLTMQSRAYVKSRNTMAVSAVNSVLSLLFFRWRALTSFQRLGWESTNIDGVSGYNLFVKLNFRNVADGSGVRVVYTISAPLFTVNTLAFSYSISTGVFSAVGSLGTSAGYGVEVSFSSLVSSGLANSSRSLRVVSYRNASAFFSGSYSAAYVAKFGDVLSNVNLQSLIFYRVVFYNRNSLREYVYTGRVVVVV